MVPSLDHDSCRATCDGDIASEMGRKFPFQVTDSWADVWLLPSLRITSVSLLRGTPLDARSQGLG